MLGIFAHVRYLFENHKSPYVIKEDICCLPDTSEASQASSRLSPTVIYQRPVSVRHRSGPPQKLVPKFAIIQHSKRPSFTHERALLVRFCRVVHGVLCANACVGLASTWLYSDLRCLYAGSLFLSWATLFPTVIEKTLSKRFAYPYLHRSFKLLAFCLQEWLRQLWS